MKRPVSYTPELGIEICARLAEGESLSRICEDEGMPNKSTVVRWAADINHPLAQQYARAREIGYQLLADEIIRISDTPVIGEKTKISDDGVEITKGDMIEHRRLQIDSRKWMLSKMLPKVYGDRVQVDQTIGFSGEFEKFMRELKGGQLIEGTANSPTSDHSWDSAETTPVENTRLIADDTNSANSRKRDS